MLRQTADDKRTTSCLLRLRVAHKLLEFIYTGLRNAAMRRLPVQLRCFASCGAALRGPSWPTTRRAASTLQQMQEATKPTSPEKETKTTKPKSKHDSEHQHPRDQRRHDRDSIEDDVPRLAKRHLHPLSLADLVRSARLILVKKAFANLFRNQTWPTTTLCRSSSLVSTLHSFSPAHPPCPPNSGATQSSLHRGLQSQH